MSVPPEAISILLVVAVSALLVLTGLRRQPGLGVLGSVTVIALAYWLRGNTIADIGLSPPANWAATLLLALGLGVVIQLLTVAVIEPLTERIAGDAHDHSAFRFVKKSWKGFLQMMVLVWVAVVFLEEGIYRGFLMTELASLIGTGWGASTLNVLITSAVFGLSHGYQNRCGVLSTGVVGAMLGGIVVLSGFNLWLAIFTHGFINTVGIGLIAVEGDTYLRRMIWRSRG